MLRSRKNGHRKGGAVSTVSQEWRRARIRDRRFLVKELKSYDDDCLPDDDHIACFSFPNCDLNPNGCVVAMGDDVECIGHRG